MEKWQSSTSRIKAQAITGEPKGKCLARHQNKPNFIAFRSPMVFFPINVMRDLSACYRVTRTECQGFGTVSRIEGGDFIGGDFHIDEIFVPPQEVDLNNTTIPKAGWSQFHDELHEQRPEEADALLDRMYFFWHVHRRSHGLAQSDNDMKTIKKKHQDSSDFPITIWAIMNRLGQMHLSIAFRDAGVLCTDIEWDIIDPEQEKHDKKWLAIMEKRLSSFETPLAPNAKTILTPPQLPLPGFPDQKSDLWPEDIGRSS